LLLISCLAVCANCGYVLAARAAAEWYGIALPMQNAAYSALLAVGTAAEVAAVVRAEPAAPVMLLPAFGAVVVGAACDAACGYVFDALTLPSLAILCALALASHTFAPFALGVAASGGSLAALHALTRGRGLGLGDVKLACCIGGALGTLAGIEALGIAFILGGLYASILLLTKRAERGQELRFAPYMAAGMAIVMLHGVFS
jgi:prepilin signal peptidase PulO-like enzyme (type II secretory pathway)